MRYFKYKIIFLYCFEIRTQYYTHKHKHMHNCNSAQHSNVYQSDSFRTWIFLQKTFFMAFSSKIYKKSHWTQTDTHTLTATDSLHFLLGSVFNILIHFFRSVFLDFCMSWGDSWFPLNIPFQQTFHLIFRFFYLPNYCECTK